MLQTTAVNLVKPEAMMVTWDIGKRCNYDCSYCTSLRHTNDSPHADFETLLKTFNFVKAWTDLYNSKRHSVSETNINFTGGEPTTNPNFWKLVDYIRAKHPEFTLGLTTNGTWGKRRLETIVKSFAGVTISWHAEADESLRQMSLNNIVEISKRNIWLQVNVMLHMDYWAESVAACEFLDQHGVNYNPVPVGDGPANTNTWIADSRGVMRRTTHTYNPDQQSWFFKKMGITEEVAEQRSGNKVGRTCCGGRCLTAKVDGNWQEVKLINTEFKDWNCMVDWYFLHIDQEFNEVYHHQTCQALHGGKRGPIGTLDNTEQLLSDLEFRLSQDTVAPIVCPNQRCGCGMCVPKAKFKDDFSEIWKTITFKTLSD